MEYKHKKIYLCVGEGVLRAFFLTLLLLLIYAIVVNSTNIQESTTSMIILIVTLLSIMYGSIYSSKKNGEKGWLNGLLVSILYTSIFFLVSIFSGNSFDIDINGIIRVALAMIVGMLSGMLGINI